MTDTAQSQAIAQMDSVAYLVAALDVDYERLEELRAARVQYIDEKVDDAYVIRDLEEFKRLAGLQWVAENPSDADELDELEEAAGDNADQDEARERLLEDALSVEVRSGWTSPGADLGAPEEFRIVLCTGGAHVELVGDLDEHGSPVRVRCLYRCWGESGELFDFDHGAALRYCSEYLPT